MRLRDLVRDIPDKKMVGDPDIEIGDLAYHSAKVGRGALFTAIEGLNTDGHTFIEEALDRGARALVLEKNREGNHRGIPIVIVPNSRAALAHVSAAFFGHPSRSMGLVGVTGTNGKTTTTFLIESILGKDDKACGVIGTISYRYADRVIPAPMTTPESYDIQRILREMLESGITHVVMEVSSHALDLRRVDACHFDVGVFTNFTQDHLDYHGNLEQYRRCKESLFTEIIPAGIKQAPRAILNRDDPVGESLWQRVTYSKTGYALGREASLWADEVTSSLDGVEATIHTPRGDLKVRSSLVGEFNLYNTMAAVGAALALGVSKRAISEGIDRFKNVPGRMERVANEYGIEIFVDYAHTPDALERALTVLRPHRGNGRLITVFGCGGDRDRKKRPLMGKAVARLSDLSIITSDNPRSENPGDIIREIEEGVIQTSQRPLGTADLSMPGRGKGYLKIEDRREAIQRVVQSARQGDIILVAGKGHENVQIVADRRLPFDDRTEVRKALLQRESNR
jgi:UDP-N-acetylmuramoyl-L-alanyl-D-glutamate--2,6-diaminopimelate ligase